MKRVCGDLVGGRDLTDKVVTIFMKLALGEVSLN